MLDLRKLLLLWLALPFTAANHLLAVAMGVRAVVMKWDASGRPLVVASPAQCMPLMLGVVAFVTLISTAVLLVAATQQPERAGVVYRIVAALIVLVTAIANAPVWFSHVG